MYFHSEDIGDSTVRQFWSALIAPRPVFLVASRSQDGIANIAPYSSISLISLRPPMIAFSIGQRQGGLKNTLENIQRTNSFSLNAVPKRLAETANESAAGHERTNDYRRLSLGEGAFERSDAPRIAKAPASVACNLVQTVQVTGSDATLLLAVCTEVFMEERYLVDGVFDPISANLIASVGLEHYITVRGEAFSLPLLRD